MATNVTNASELKAAIAELSREQLEEGLFDIATRLSFDEHGNYSPDESVASESGGDFIESVTFTFHRLEINL